VCTSDVFLFLFFFFQAEDGIRDFHVTGVQTCALPIFGPAGQAMPGVTLQGSCQSDDGALFGGQKLVSPWSCTADALGVCRADVRSEERRVGEEGRWRWSARH